MKSYLLSLAIYFVAINLSFAILIDEETKRTCFLGNGINESTDVDPLLEFLRSNDDQKEFHLEKQYSCAVSCIIDVIKSFHKKSTYQLLSEVIKNDAEFSGKLKKEMMYRLDNCHQEDHGDDCKLLYCVKIIRPPFKKILPLLQSKPIRN